MCARQGALAWRCDGSGTIQSSVDLARGTVLAGKGVAARRPSRATIYLLGKDRTQSYPGGKESL